MLNLKTKIELHDNDYTDFEPFEHVNSNLQVSIIIPVFNHAVLLERTLFYLLNIIEASVNPHQYEVVIINDASTEDIDSVIREIDSPIELKYISLPVNMGCANARNVGIKVSEGDILFFLDSDIVIKGQYFDSQLRIHERVMSFGQHALVVGMLQNIYMEIDKDIPPLDEMESNIENDFRFNDNGEVWIPNRRKSQIMYESDFFKDFSVVDGFSLPEMVVGCSLSIEKSIAQEVGGFNTNFQGWGLEDTFLGACAIGRGCYIIPSLNEPSFKIEHSPRADGVMEEQCISNTKLYHKLLKETYY